jgi:serine/threonine protein kinase
MDLIFGWYIERDILSILDHPSIVKLEYAIEESKTEKSLVFELVEG